MTGLAAIYGPSGCGKSFLVLDLAVAIAQGTDWFGHRTKATPVVYVALEGEAGLRNRVAALVKVSGGLPLPVTLEFVHSEPFKLTAGEDVAALAATVTDAHPSGAVVILDTLNRAAPGADENSSVDMGQILEAAKQLQALTGGLVVLVHHTGKDTSRGMRGHSSLIAALDSSLEVCRIGTARQWKVAKSKDGVDGVAHGFQLEVVDLGQDADGDRITSCVVKPDTAPMQAAATPPQGANQNTVHAALLPLFAAGALGTPCQPTKPCILLEAALNAGAAVLTCPADKRRSRAREAIVGMSRRGTIGMQGDWIWKN